MIAVVYSGSRYATWELADRGKLVSEFRTVGINPYFDNEQLIISLMNKTNELITHAERIKRIYFFGAGASSKERRQVIANALKTFFRNAKVSIQHDLKAAALATCGDTTGIVGIIGSGSNAAYYDGKKIEKNNYGLGFVLSDEGSSNWLGRKLLKNFLTQTMPMDFREKFHQKYGLDRKQILEKVYRNPQPVLFLSSFSGFLRDNKDNKYVRQIVTEGFNSFLNKCIVPLSEKHPGEKIHFAGTVAFTFENLLKDTAQKHGLQVSTVLKAPINNVLNYYINKN
ncbi:hypothetical protein GS399_17640 [Pedobacter sp. HMF7647]|uniref:N-acetylglucosamine kinase n=1 Tax=Hufsiella arboris TaxID=2695275 RepID=A0A7K1YFP6_9SPHI|nr:hypothetical protein [Hufsiella arboris]MXV52799.1 hypothetical protein [Hufsiella arboris]